MCVKLEVFAHFKAQSSAPSSSPPSPSLPRLRVFLENRHQACSYLRNSAFLFSLLGSVFPQMCTWLPPALLHIWYPDPPFSLALSLAALLRAGTSRPHLPSPQFYFSSLALLITTYFTYYLYVLPITFTYYLYILLTQLLVSSRTVGVSISSVPCCLPQGLQWPCT